jgi:hypothetical protein
MGPNEFRKGKIFPFLQLYRCKVSVFQPPNAVQVNMVQEARQRMDNAYGVPRGPAGMIPGMASV